MQYVSAAHMYWCREPRVYLVFHPKAKWGTFGIVRKTWEYPARNKYALPTRACARTYCTSFLAKKSAHSAPSHQSNVTFTSWCAALREVSNSPPWARMKSLRAGSISGGKTRNSFTTCRVHFVGPMPNKITNESNVTLNTESSGVLPNTRSNSASAK